MNGPDLSCKDARRRDDVRVASLYGLDYVEVSDDQLTLEVFFLGKAPKKIEKENIRIEGGRRIRDVRVLDLRVQRQMDPTLDDVMEVRVNKSGDFSTYTLRVVALDEKGHPTDQPMPGFDSRYDEVEFTFKAGCSGDLDCKPQQVCPPPQRTQPEINYLAKDYPSFRQLILDRLALIMPNWQETHVPDIGITLVELLAYVGDHLSYYQDAVATEAYLGTGRRRISVRRHVRLVDYLMHEGCNSRAWVTIHTDIDGSLDPKQIYFITGFTSAPDTHVLQPADLVNVPTGSYEVFEPLVEDPTQLIRIYGAHSEIHFYTWGDCECCLAAGATSATLTDQWVTPPCTQPVGTQPGGTQPGTEPGTGYRALASTPSQPAATASSDGPPGTVRALNLNVGDVLVFEEVIGPKTGNPADADPKHRQAIRLTKVTPAIDPLNPYRQPSGQPVVEIEWCSEDALTFPLCISALAPPPDCTCMENVSVARGNVILVDNGSTTGEPLGTVPTESTTERCPTDCEPAEVEIVAGRFRPSLHERPLTFSQPLPPCGCAITVIAQDPRQALPWIRLSSIPPAPGGATSLFSFDDLQDPTRLAKNLRRPLDPASQFLCTRLSAGTRQALDAWDGPSPLPGPLRTALIDELQQMLGFWTPRRDLLESGADDRHFVVEMDNDGYGHLRFGDGELGEVPDAGTAFLASYRVGNGPSGNVGAETIAYLVSRQTTLSSVTVAPRNPLLATGGTAPEPLAEVKLFAPYAFRKVLERAITADDYAALAGDNRRRLAERSALIAAVMGAGEGSTEEEESSGPPTPGLDTCFAPFRKLQGAKATLRWTGSWYEALVAIDPLGTEEADPQLLEDIAAYLEPYRRMGHDLEVRPAQYVPIDLGLTVCVQPHYLRGHVEAALLDVFSNRVLPDARLGFFHPDNLTFGKGIYVSQIVAAAQAVPGLQSVRVTRLERFEVGEPPLGTETPEDELPPHSVLPLGPFEIARLDNDPSFPENGRLVLDMRGGR